MLVRSAAGRWDPSSCAHSAGSQSSVSVSQNARPGELAVAPEGPLDPLVGDPRAAAQAPVVRARPRVEDQPLVAAEQHHHVRHRVGSDAGDLPAGGPPPPDRAAPGRAAPRGRAGRRRRRRRAHAGTARGSRRGRYPGRTPRRRRATVAGAGNAAALRRAGRRRPELADERADHPHGRRPCAVGRADRLDEVLEHRRAAHHPPGAGDRPRPAPDRPPATR